MAQLVKQPALSLQLLQQLVTSVVTAAAGVTAVVGVHSLAQELPHAVGAAKKKKKKLSSQQIMTKYLLFWVPNIEC